MEEFLKCLSIDEQREYRRLYKEFKRTENVDEMKKYIPHLIILKERGNLNLMKNKRERSN